MKELEMRGKEERSYAFSEDFKVNQFEDNDLILRRHSHIERGWFQICTNWRIGTSQESYESCTISEVTLQDMRCEGLKIKIRVKEQLLKILKFLSIQTNGKK
jgi:hypothetical protein